MASQAIIPSKKTSESVVSALVGVVRHPHVSEKAYRVSGLRQYAFIVRDRASKRQIQEAIEAKYGVTVIAVNTIRTPGKARRWKNVRGVSTRPKKAFVTLKEGERIELS
jgi:large subunit ribosomal protein L23